MRCILLALCLTGCAASGMQTPCSVAQTPIMVRLRIPFAPFTGVWHLTALPVVSDACVQAILGE